MTTDWKTGLAAEVLTIAEVDSRVYGPQPGSDGEHRPRMATD